MGLSLRAAWETKCRPKAILLSHAGEGRRGGSGEGAPGTQRTPPPARSGAGGRAGPPREGLRLCPPGKRGHTPHLSVCSCDAEP